MKHWLWLALFGSTVVQADMLDALKAYESKDYVAAQQQFAELLPLGNELAAFNLGAMAYQGEGQPADLSQALAYFMLAADMQHKQAPALVAKLVQQVTEQQLEKAHVHFEQLKRNVVIVSGDLTAPVNYDSPQPIKRIAPKYPVDAAKSGQFGYVTLRFLVNEQGEVTAIDTLDAYPAKVFDRSAIQAVKRWRYQPSDKSHLLNVKLEFSLSGAFNEKAMQKVVEDNNLWRYAVAGAPRYQYALGTLMSLMEVQSSNLFWFNPELPLTAEPDYSIYKTYPQLKADFEGFVGNAVVRVSADGTITEQIKADFSPQSEINNLVGLKLSGNVGAKVYKLARVSLTDSKKVSVSPSIEASPSMSGMFWWEQAAKNGDVDAQRVLAAYKPQWETYMLSKQDAEVMAWVGTRMMLDGQHELGVQYLEQAIAKNYEVADELRKQFAWYKSHK